MKDKDARKPATEQVSIRLDRALATRFNRVVEASRRSKTSIVEECLEELLPQLEQRYKQAA